MIEIDNILTQQVQRFPVTSVDTASEGVGVDGGNATTEGVEELVGGNAKSYATDSVVGGAAEGLGLRLMLTRTARYGRYIIPCKQESVENNAFIVACFSLPLYLPSGEYKYNLVNVGGTLSSGVLKVKLSKVQQIKKALYE